MHLPIPKNTTPPPPFTKSDVKNAPDRVVRAMLSDNPEILRRTEGVVAMAREIATRIPKHTGDLLVLAAYYHNIGASTLLSDETEFSPLRGAMWAKAVGLPLTVVRAIFECSGARVFAKMHPEAAEWYAVNPEKPSPLSMYLCYCDLRVDSAGSTSPLPVKFKEMQEQYDEGTPYSRVIAALWPYYEAVMLTIERRLNLQFNLSPECL